MANHYSGSVHISPPLNEKEYTFLLDYLEVMKNYRNIKKSANNSKVTPEEAQGVLENFLALPLTPKQAQTFYTAYCENTVLHKEKIECLDIFTEQSFFKQSLETLNLFFFKEQILVKMLNLSFFQPHHISGLIKGLSDDDYSKRSENWFYEIDGDKIYNIENGKKILKSRVNHANFDNWREKILLLDNTPNPHIPHISTPFKKPLHKL